QTYLLLHRRPDVPQFRRGFVALHDRRVARRQHLAHHHAHRAGVEHELAPAHLLVEGRIATLLVQNDDGVVAVDRVDVIGPDRVDGFGQVVRVQVVDAVLHPLDERAVAMATATGLVPVRRVAVLPDVDTAVAHAGD